ncbi:MAG: hypothetical protein WCR45_11785 [Bacteroidaceae bacterium]
MSKSPRMSKKRFFKIYEEFKSTDLTVNAFCKTFDYNSPSFYRWINRWVKEDYESKIVPISIVNSNAGNAGSSNELTDNSFSSQPSSFAGLAQKRIEVKLRNGTEVRFTGAIDTDLLLTILSL